MKRLYLFLWGICMVCLSAAAQNYMFKCLEVKDGLPNNQINSICKDSRGFLWFGTASGLARYDGYRFRTFRHDDSRTTSIPDNFVENIVEDSEGRLWMRIGETNYTFFDPVAETFENDMRGYMWNIGINGVPQGVMVDKEKTLWFYVPGVGCYRYRAGEKKAEGLLFTTGGLPQGNITGMIDSKEGILLAYSNGRIVCIDSRRMALKWTLTDITEMVGEEYVETFSLFVDRDEDLWIYGAPGLWVYNLKSKEWKKNRNDRISNLSHNMIRSITQDRKGHIWLGKDQEGIDVLDKKTGKITSLISHPDNERGLPHNTIMELYEDAAGIMWVGTYKKGVAYYDESIYKFALSPLGDVNAIEDGRDGTLWLGTNDGGLVHWNPQSGEKNTFLRRGENSLTANVVVSLLKAKDGRLWIGTFWGGLDCYDGHRFVHYRHQPGNPNSLSNNNVWSLAEDEEGNIWIGTLSGGVQRLNPKTGVFTNYNVATCGLISDYIASICMGRNNRLIIGTASSGISILDLNTGRATNYVGTKSGNARFSNQSVNQVYEDSRGLIWIATRDGLNLYDPVNDGLQVISLPQEISGRFISGIVEDKHRNMWVTTADGVVNMVVLQDKRSREYTFHFHVYNDKDGLQGSEFNLRSIERLASGEVVMGGLYGINIFNPDVIKYNRTQPKVIFTDFRLFNEEVEVGREYGGRVVLDKSLNHIGELTLDYRQNVFTVVFASDNYVLPEKTHYIYKLEGFDNDWMTSASDMRRATYTNLAPGTYVLRVKAVNSDGFAGTEEAVLKIVILPPFWQTTWAYIFYVLLLVGIIYLSIRAVERKERNKFKIRQMEQDARKMEEVNQMKFRFFTNVSHELRTPLTLIISPLESMMKEVSDDKQLGRLTLMHRNALRLLNLVNQLLDFRKSEVAGLHLTPAEGDIVTFVRHICASFLMLSEKKNVHLTFYSAVESLNMLFDEDKMGKVVMNLLSNAFKFTPEGGRVDVSVEVLKGEPDKLLLKVSDTGTGIKDEDKEHIFERFYQVNHPNPNLQSTGSGIGLSLVHDFVTLHEGTVQVLDNVSVGSVFLVTIPIKQVSREGVVSKSGRKKEAEKVFVESEIEQILEEENEALSDDMDDTTDGGDKEQPLVLVVDDSDDLVAFMKDSLSLYFRIQTASNGREAWQLIPDLQPDIIVSDVMMPEMDGNELCRWVKTDKRTENIPVILLTAKQAVEDKVESLTIGADDYVTKPFNVEVLILRMRKLIDLYGKRRQRLLIEPEPSRIVITSLDEQLVADAIKYVEANIGRSDLSVEELSRELGMSRVHLYKKLSQITGKTPIEFIRIIRLKRAAQLLRESQRNVSEIAYQLGFNNPKYFSKYFRDEFGVLPSVYQEREGK
ncbi:two-component regulator propeller domain-containing protein [Bacteroides heparinolyticus]|uniref:hybrid sensor histidine kinase/response regulator transcription factor n=1 Tax=Prevotella heparinolytica TaxID=28113 RepID=UPI0035A16AD3